MKYKGPICPSCGKESEAGEICASCRVGKTEWFRCEKRVDCIRCPGCGAKKTGSTWTDDLHGIDEETLAKDLVRSAIILHPDLRNPSFAMAIRATGTNRSAADVQVKGVLYGLPVEGACRVEIAWLREQCDRCSRISGSYYEGVVQVRAQGRQPEYEEIRQAVEIAEEVEESMIANGERLSYISKMDETREGLDITVGSQQIGQAIASAITQRLGGRFTTHPKLVGEKAGRALYRITYSLRLPRYKKGDIIEIATGYGEVLHEDPVQVRFVDLGTGMIRSVRKEDIRRLVGNVRDAEEAIIAFIDGNTVGLLEPGTGVTKECCGALCRRAIPGESMLVLRDGETLIPVR